jgi:pyruvate kinase
MPRRTKIVATLGPASSDKKTLARMIEAGLDVVRMNFSHGTAKEHTQRVELVRELARKAGRAVGVLVDLQGPKIRIGRFEHDRISLITGDKFVLDADCTMGDANRVGLDYKNLPQDVTPGDTLLLDDGRVVLAVKTVKGARINCVVAQGGALSNNKGINRKGGGLTAPALTEKDVQDIKTAAKLKADYLAVSFPRSGADIQWARDLMLKAGGRSLVCAKIERAEAIPALAEILDASDAIMVARGRSRGGSRRCGGPGIAKAHDPHGARAQQAGDYRDANDGIDDHQPDPNARGSVGRCQCRAGWHRCRDAFRGDCDRKVPGRDHRRDEPCVSGG